MSPGGVILSVASIRNIIARCMKNVKMMNENSNRRSLLGKAAVAGCIWLIAVNIYAQDNNRSLPLNDLGSSSRERSSSTVVQSAGVALESIVDPEKYYVGPSR